MLKMRRAVGSISFQHKKATSKMSCAGNVFLAYGREENRINIFCKIFCASQ